MKNSYSGEDKIYRMEDLDPIIQELIRNHANFSEDDWGKNYSGSEMKKIISACMVQKQESEKLIVRDNQVIEQHSLKPGMRVRIKEHVRYEGEIIEKFFEATISKIENGKLYYNNGECCHAISFVAILP